MITNKENQCIIISGESGAGKTEASKIILGFIAAASKQSKDVEAINELLLQSNPIMEAFGNGNLQTSSIPLKPQPKPLVMTTQVVSVNIWKSNLITMALQSAAKSLSIS